MKVEMTTGELLQKLEEATLNERERCAKIADSWAMRWDIPCRCPVEIAAKIRSGK